MDHAEKATGDEHEYKPEHEHQLLQRSSLVGMVQSYFGNLAQLRAKLERSGSGRRVRKLLWEFEKIGFVISRRACEGVGLEGEECDELFEAAAAQTEAVLADDIDVEDAGAREKEQLIIEIEELRGALDDAHADLDDAHAELDQVHAVLAEKDATTASLKVTAAEADALRRQLDRERALRQHAQDDAEQADSKLRAERRRNDELEAELRQARRDLALSADATLVTALTAKLDKVTRERDALRSSELSTAEQTQALHRKISLLKARNQNASTRGSALTESDGDISDDQGTMNTNDDDLKSGGDDESSAEDDNPAGMHRNLDVYHVRAMNKKKNMEVTLWSGKDLSWSVLFGTLVRIIKWRYIGDKERGASRRYQSFQSTAVALAAFFIAFGVTQVTGDIPLTSDEEETAKENIDVIVAKLDKTCSESIQYDNADKLAEAAKHHVPSLWSKLKDVKRSGENIWNDSNRVARQKKKNMHQVQKDLYVDLGISFNNASKKK